jgi:hypothetical protein
MEGASLTAMDRVILITLATLHAFSNVRDDATAATAIEGSREWPSFFGSGYTRVIQARGLVPGVVQTTGSD